MATLTDDDGFRWDCQMLLGPYDSMEVAETKATEYMLARGEKDKPKGEVRRDYSVGAFSKKHYVNLRWFSGWQATA